MHPTLFDLFNVGCIYLEERVYHGSFDNNQANVSRNPFRGAIGDILERKNNMLYRVASENENTVTEIFVNLMRWKYVRDILLKSIELNEYINGIEFDHISTQVTIINQKRPDIVIENEDFVFFIENKIYKNTQLQDSQCNEYYLELERRKQANKRLIFLVPQNYEHEDEIISSCKKYKIQTQIIYWENVLTSILESGVCEANICIKENVDFLLNTLSLNSTMKTFTIQEVVYMFDLFAIKSISMLLRKTERYSNEVMEKILHNYKDKYNLIKTKYESSDNKIGTCVINNEGTWVFFLGYIFDVEDQDFAYSFRVDKCVLKNTVVDINKYKYSERDKWLFFAIPKEKIVDELNVPNEINTFIDKVIKELCK